MRGHAVKERRSNSTGLIPGTADLLGWYKADQLVATGPGSGGITVVDSFSDADGTNLNGKQTDGGGKTWVVGGGTLDINAGKARVTAGSGSSWATIETGYSDFDMSVVITTGANAIDGVIFRLADASNYLRLDIGNVDDRLFLLKNIAGTETEVANVVVAGLTVGNVATYRVICAGRNIKIYRDGVLKMDVIESSHEQATKHGVIGFSTNTRFDDFSLSADALVSTWEDRSGLSSDLTTSPTTLSARPKMRWNRCNGLPMVEFDGVDDYIGRTANPFGTGSVQVLVVAIWRVAGRAVIGGFADKHALADTTSFWRLSNGTGLTVTNTAAPPLNQPVIMGYRFDGGAAGRLSTDRRQTGETLSGVGGVGAVTAWGIGGSNSSGGPPPNVFFSGWVGEVIIYDRELTEPERVGIIEYLAQKWLGRSWA